jgi:signal transduction histidine kinase
MGMGNLVERAEAVNGSLDVESNPGRGTLIRLTVPL